MAPGPLPKPPGKRRRTNTPQRGEWVDLQPPESPILPTLPALGHSRQWSPRVVAAWEAWRVDPSSTQYGPAEIAAAIELAFVMQHWIDGAETAAEVRIRMDALGLSAKGKRDLRWRPPAETATHMEQHGIVPRPRPVRQLRAVDPAG